MLLHVGRRDYPGADNHKEILERNGSNDNVDRLAQLPEGFRRGMLVAIVELGETYETTLRERQDAAFEGRAAAYGADCGKFATVIRRVEYLQRPVPMSAQPGVFNVSIDPCILPDDSQVSHKTAGNNEGKPLYSISA